MMAQNLYSFIFTDMANACGTKKRRIWTDLSMERAYNAVVSERMSIRKASIEFDVPRMTLSDRVNGRIHLHAKLGQQTALTAGEEDALANYVTYMHSKRFPVTRSQVMGLAWAMDLKKNPSERSFGEEGPTFKWWRGFKARNPNLTLRKVETVERGRVSNATEEIFNDYFDQLENILRENDLMDKPSQIYNCDEAAVFLNKHAQKVVVPRNTKHCQTLTQGTSEHISVLCTIRADGGFVMPLIVFSKGLPTLRGFEKQFNASYAATETGFVNQDLYVSWFTKTFIPNIPPQRPVLLIQDSATAHISPELIETAIQNDIILFCLPGKLTHVLQPCDVSIFKKMRAEINKIMLQIKMMRGDNWVSKGRFPAVFREVFERTMIPATITNAFRKCGIVPIDRNAIEKEFIMNQPERIKALQNQTEDQQKTEPEKNRHDQSTNDKDTDDAPSGSPLEVEVTLELVTSPSNIPAGAEVVLENSSGNDPGDTTACPPHVALQAIEATLTPKKMASYQKKFKDGVTERKDPVYATWSNLTHQVKAQAQAHQPELEHPLVKAGIIPKRLGDIFPSPESNAKASRKPIRLKANRARVLTSMEISNEVFEKDRLKKQNVAEKEMRKKLRDERKKNALDEKKKKQSEKGLKRKRSNSVSKQNKKQKKSTDSSSKNTPVATTLPTERRYFSHMQIMLASCRNLGAIRKVVPSDIPYTIGLKTDLLNSCNQFAHGTDHVSQTLLNTLGLQNMTAVPVYGDGNCLPRAASFLCSGNESDLHTEMRVRMVMKLAAHYELYVNDEFLSKPEPTKPGISTSYAMYSGQFENDLSMSQIFEKEVMHVIKPGSYCSMWQLHGLASVLGTPLRVLYPGKGAPRVDLNKTIVPRIANSTATATIMWTHTSNTNVTAWWQPNHFVPVLGSTQMNEKKVEMNDATRGSCPHNDTSSNQTPQSRVCYCIVCAEEFGMSKENEVWVQCQGCLKWAHEDCTPKEGPGYICDLCLP